MRSLRVVVMHPLVHELTHVGQRAKQVGVEQLAAERAIDALDVGILGGITGLNPVRGNTYLSHHPFRRTLINFLSVVGA